MSDIICYNGNKGRYCLFEPKHCPKCQILFVTMVIKKEHTKTIYLHEFQGLCVLHNKYCNILSILQKTTSTLRGDSWSYL